jgi:hypothetical protein
MILGIVGIIGLGVSSLLYLSTFYLAGDKVSFERIVLPPFFGCFVVGLPYLFLMQSTNRKAGLWTCPQK